MEKKELRKIVRASKNAVSFDEKCRRSKPLMDSVASLEAFRQSKTVLLYWSMDDEVFTHDFVEKFYREKTLLLPCVKDNDLLLRQYKGPDSLVDGPQFGIPEPVGELFEDLNLVDMIVVPGVAFDRKGNRMGRGRGFYDRLLKSTPNALKVGVCFDFQLFDEIPTEDFDVPMDFVVSESTCLLFS